MTVLGSYGRVSGEVPVGYRAKLDPGMVTTVALRTGRPARMNGERLATGPFGAIVGRLGMRAAVATPIVVEGHYWGVAVAATSREDFPPGTESRMAEFMELAATAIANAESRARVTRLAEEQAALRRVATLVARGGPPEEVFAAVTEEVGRLLPVELAGMCRYESDGTVTFVATWGSGGEHFLVGSRGTLGGQNLGTLVFETGRPARIDGYADASGPLGVTAHEHGIGSAVGTPVIVEGRLWGVMGIYSTPEQPLSADTEARLANFTELVATAIANAETRAALAASRARIVAAADETRRRIERDLHDGAQQRLVSLGLELRAAQAAVPPELNQLEGELSHVADGLARLQEELREIARGIHPAILAEGGVERALKALARRSSVPVELDMRARGRLPERVEVATYYIAAEALTNAAKHANASVVRVAVEASEGVLRLSVSDDGGGGADPTRGSGLVGLKDRVQTLGGTIAVRSPPGAGTFMHVELPLMEQ